MLCVYIIIVLYLFYLQQLLGGDGSNNEQIKWNHRQQPQVTSRAVLEFAYNVTLAQAQECILEKSMMDGRKSLIIGIDNNNVQINSISYKIILLKCASIKFFKKL